MQFSDFMTGCSRSNSKMHTKMLSKQLNSIAIRCSCATSKNRIGSFVSGIKYLKDSFLMTSFYPDELELLLPLHSVSG